MIVPTPIPHRLAAGVLALNNAPAMELKGRALEAGDAHRSSRKF
jgi:hypothetical protein